MVMATYAVRIQILEAVLSSMSHRELMQWTYNRDCERVLS